METGQQRAKVGGEFGANGEWYEGGKFIATRDNPKSAPVVISDEERARRDTYQSAQSARDAAFNTWLQSRLLQFADLIASLESFPADEFYASLASQIRSGGSLSIKQSRYAVKFFLGRRTKKNTDAWDDIDFALTERFVEQVPA